MKNPVDDIHARARQRVAWPVRKYRLADAPRDDIALATAAERLAMMWPIALDAWSFTGRTLPDYARANAPVRVIRPQDLADVDALEGVSAGKKDPPKR